MYEYFPKPVPALNSRWVLLKFVFVKLLSKRSIGVLIQLNSIKIFVTHSTKSRNKSENYVLVPRERQLYGLSNGAKGNYQSLLVAELLFDKEKVPRVI